MGMEKKDRQDELFDLRVERRKLLVALAQAICGSNQDQKAAKETLLDLAANPTLAPLILSTIDTLPAKLREGAADVWEVARLNATPRPHLIAAVSVH